MLPVYPLTTEQIEIQNLARNFATKEIESIHLDEAKSLQEGGLLDKICQSGLVNTRIPEEFGGLGLSLLETCLILEQLAFADSGISSSAEASELAITYLLLSASQPQKSKYLSMLTETNGLAGFALSHKYQSPGNKSLSAIKKNDSIILDGHCPFVLNATFAKWLLLTCPFFETIEQEKNNASHAQLAYFIVPNNINGLEILDPAVCLGRLATDARAMRFTKVELEPIAKLNIESLADSASLKSDIALPANSSIIASGCLGIAKSAFIQAKNYAQERRTFGIPIAKHQAIAFMMADMLTDIEASQTLTYDTIQSASTQQNNQKMAASTLKFALDMAVHVTNDAVQVLGGYGYTKDYKIEKLMRDAKAYQLFYRDYQSEHLSQALIQEV